MEESQKILVCGIYENGKCLIESPVKGMEQVIGSVMSLTPERRLVIEYK